MIAFLRGAIVEKTADHVIVDTGGVGYQVAVADMSKDETKVLVRTYSDRSLGAYYFFDRESGDFTKLVDVSPWLDES